MKLILKNGIVYDPANGINGERMDICIKDGKIVEKVRFAKVIDVSNKLVMPAGFDIHSHIAGGKVNVGRLLRPEDSLRRVVARRNGLRSGSGYSVPSVHLIGYDYARLGYTTVITPAMPPLLSRHTHHELNEIPMIDKAAFPLYDGNWFVMKYISEEKYEELKAYVAWLLWATKGYSVKITNPGGTEAWGWRKNVHDLDEEVPYFGVTPKEIITSLVDVCNDLNLPHSVHLHCNCLGEPGNYEITIKTLQLVRHKDFNGRQSLHVTHLQFHSYGGDSWKTFESKADEVAKEVNKNDNVIIDTGNVIFGDTTTMTADAPMEYDLYLLTGLKWVNKDVELETAPGVTPYIYSPKVLVNAIQWAVGLELALLIKPEKVILTTDSPNGGIFTNYPKVIAWLMSKKARDDMLAKVHKSTEHRTVLPSIDKEYDFYEIAMVTRTNPAKSAGMPNKGHLGVGADADIAVYDINPLEFDPKDYEKLEKALSNAYLTIKGGEIIVKEGEIVKVTHGRTFWVDAMGKIDRSLIEKDLDYYFKRYYSVSLSNYVIGENELRRSERICVN